MIYEYKHTGETTEEFAERIKEKHNAKHVAICGKLDPMARGFTLILLDEQRKQMDRHLNRDKTYRFSLMIGIKTTSDDIMGSIKDISTKTDKIPVIIDFIHDYIRNQKTQKFHPYSAKRLNIDGVNKPLHYWENMNMLNYQILPEKSINVNSLKIIHKDSFDFGVYRNTVLRLLNKTSNKSRNIFNIEQIEDCWRNIEFSEDIHYIDIEMNVTSGYYIRMIPYYLYFMLGIPSHIFDISRISG